MLVFWRSQAFYNQTDRKVEMVVHRRGRHGTIAGYCRLAEHAVNAHDGDSISAIAPS